METSKNCTSTCSRQLLLRGLILVLYLLHPYSRGEHGLLKSVTYSFVLSLLKPVLSIAEGHERIIFISSQIFEQSIAQRMKIWTPVEVKIVG